MPVGGRGVEMPPQCSRGCLGAVPPHPAAGRWVPVRPSRSCLISFPTSRMVRSASPTAVSLPHVPCGTPLGQS